MANPKQPDTTLPIGATYKQYVAVLIQDGTNAPVPTILANTLGDIIWTRGSTGFYVGTLANKFTTDKSWALITPDGDWSTGATNTLSVLNDENTINVYNYNASNVAADGMYAYLLIRVYN